MKAPLVTQVRKLYFYDKELKKNKKGGKVRRGVEIVGLHFSYKTRLEKFLKKKIKKRNARKKDRKEDMLYKYLKKKRKEFERILIKEF